MRPGAMIPAMATALDSERVQGVLDELQRLGALNDREYGAQVRQREAELGEKLYEPYPRTLPAPG